VYAMAEVEIPTCHVAQLEIRQTSRGKNGGLCGSRVAQLEITADVAW
jgi:hypothetical protein